MTVRLYMTSVTTNRELYHRQTKIKMILESKRIPYELIDLSQNIEQRQEMRDKVGIPTALPPQIFNDDSYCGDYQAFEDAVETGTLSDFLQI